jgi:nicotinamidase-related amidase
MRHPALLSAKESVLLVIDPQTRLMPLIESEAIVTQNIALLVQSAQILGVPVLATTQYAARLGDIVPAIKDVMPSATMSVPVHDKMHFSAASQQDFALALKDLNRQQVVVCGVETHICVLQTAADLSAQGYRVQVACDAVGSRKESTHRAGLERIQALGILCPPTESVLYEWLEEAGTAQFKQVLPLVK